MKRFSSFEQLIDFVKDVSDVAKSKRIEEEKELFINRGWKQYVLFIVNFLNRIDAKGKEYVFLSLSAMDSYIICKATGFNKMSECMINSEKKREILFNDALRLDIEIIGLMEAFKDKIFEIGNILEDELRKASFCYKERMLMTDRVEDRCEQIVVSEATISEKVMQVVINETKQGTEEEDNILRKLLLIKFGYKNRL